VSPRTSSDDEEDRLLLARAVSDLADATRFPVAFGGMETGGGVTVTSVIGGQTRSLHGLHILPQRGLGGRAMVEARPRLTADYGTSTQITHDYDEAILGEGIATLLAVPVVVGGRTRAVLYGGSRRSGPTGDVFAKPAVEIADELGRELRVRDEVRRRVARLAAEAPAAGLAPAQREELRESYAELRSIAAAVADPSLRSRLEALEDRLAGLSGEAIARLPDVRLSPRETDVLACAALGYTNAQVADALGLKEGTVKAYLASAMSKLDASTRHAAVTKARRAGILP
jgi:DNA-binding CsgD family transcriptional regulator